MGTNQCTAGAERSACQAKAAALLGTPARFGILGDPGGRSHDRIRGNSLIMNMQNVIIIISEKIYYGYACQENGFAIG